MKYVYTDANYCGILLHRYIDNSQTQSIAKCGPCTARGPGLVFTLSSRVVLSTISVRFSYLQYSFRNGPCPFSRFDPGQVRLLFFRKELGVYFFLPSSAEISRALYKS